MPIPKWDKPVIRRSIFSLPAGFMGVDENGKIFLAPIAKCLLLYEEARGVAIQRKGPACFDA